jgi:hypothetical protein
MHEADAYLERIRAEVDEEIDNELYGPPRTIGLGDCRMCEQEHRRRESLAGSGERAEWPGADDGEG